MTTLHNPQLILDTVNKAIDAAHLTRLSRVSSTHGGEYAGSCPRCKALGIGGENVDRFVVWPERPVSGEGSRDEPCFMCRRCTRLDDVSKVWTGDLPQFLVDVYGMKFPEARMYLGLDPITANATSVLLRPMLSTTGAPHDLWQQRAFDFAKEAEERLWSTAGAPYLNYLMKQRGLTEETIRVGHLGCVTETHYVNASEWGEGQDRMVIQRGIVFPEYHALAVDGVRDLAVWSIAIRRSDNDIALEYAQTQRKPEKYHVIRGSHKGLYAYESIKPGFPVALVEGQIDALTVLQEGCGEFGAVALQSAMGGRSLLWMTRITYAKFVLIMTDPDHAGQDAYKYWTSVLEPDRQMLWVPRGGDINFVHTSGGNVYEFLREGLTFYERLVASTSEPTEGGNTVALVDTPLRVTDSLSFVSEARRHIQAQSEDVENDVPDLECSDCHTMGYSNLMHAWAKGEDDADFVCASCYAKRLVAQPKCYKCGVDLIDYEGLQSPFFCMADFAAAQLLSEGSRIDWVGFTINLLIVQGGYNNYLKFIREHDREDIKYAMWHAHALAGGFKAETIAKEPRVIAHPCARHPGGCEHDAQSYVAQVFYPKKFDPITKQWSAERSIDWNGKRHYMGNQWLHWCAACTDAYNALCIAEQLGFPAFHRAGVRTEAGVAAWVETLSHAPESHVTIFFDELRRMAPAVWEEVRQIINV